ncbi:MAG: M28 family metallopeptidase [Burkholderiales bacterium]|nr:M28 family metallopeptidase [Burkholderiales bacterium]
MLRAVLLSVLALSATLSALDISAEPKPDLKAYRAHVEFLADDLLEGRETGSRGYDIAAKYVATQFALNGALPMGDVRNDGQRDYLQVIPFRSSKLDPDSPVFELRGKDGKVDRWTFSEDYYLSSSFFKAEESVTAPLVYVGYGIVAPRFGIDDYAGLDVKGKIVVQLTGAPMSLPGEEAAHYSSGLLKREAAQARGAVGIISLQTPASEMVFPFVLGKQYLGGTRFAWLDKSGQPARFDPRITNGASLSLKTAEKLLAPTGARLADLVAAANDRKPPARLDFGVTVHMAHKSILKDVTSSNVVAVIPGSDPVLKDEYVVFMGHLDHIGLATAPGLKPGDDKINNGAIDNATGIATLLETARIFAGGEKPKRSIMLLAVTGEEKGLIGSDYFAMFPTVDKKKLAAVINLDMPILLFDFRDVIAFGIEQSTMDIPTRRAVEKRGLSLTPDPWPNQRIFTRSDQYSFVKQGVPSIFLTLGIHSFQKDGEGQTAFNTFMQKYYHRPTDEVTLPIHWDAALRFVQLNVDIGREIANTPERPKWRPGNFFADTYGTGK